MNRRERLIATFKGEPVDRLAVNFYEIGGFHVNPDDPDEFNVYNDPSWRPLLRLAEEQTDIMRMCGPILTKASNNPISEYLSTEEYIENGSKFVRTTLNVGGRTMTSLTRRDPEVDTIWTVEHLLKNVADLEAYLQLPDDVFSFDVDISNLLNEDELIGDKGVVMVDTSDPLCMAAGLFSMEDYLIIALTEQSLFHRLLEKMASYVYEVTETVAKGFCGHLWRICGAEYAAEPYLPPRLFQEYVTEYTGHMVDVINKYGGYPRIHCHGRIRNILPYIADMGPMGLDPIEPPPQGDVELSYVRKNYGKQMVLFGNIEVADIEEKDPADFEKIVEKALREGTEGEGRGYVLMPTSCPYGRKISDRVLANYETMVRLASTWDSHYDL